MKRRNDFDDEECLPRTAMDVIWMMIEELRDAESELEYITTDEFRQLPYQKQLDVWFDARELVEDIQHNQKKLMNKMKELFDHSYHQSVELIDILSYAVGRKSR